MGGVTERRRDVKMRPSDLKGRVLRLRLGEHQYKWIISY